MDIGKNITEKKSELIELRRDFHRHPELGLEEFRTGDKVAAYLESLGLKVNRMNVTGVSAFLEGDSSGPTLLLRADMDALPIQEETDLPFKSINDDVMHACGHDAHTAILMVTAKILSEQKQPLKGNIKFVFEPNEENVGALAMIEEGVMDNPQVDACMGLHVWNQLPTGQVAITPGPIMAGVVQFELIIKGRGGHTAAPQSAVDPILTAASVIQDVQAIQTREIDVLKEPTNLIFGKIQGGTASNVIPDSVMLGGTLRYMFEGPEDSPENPKKRFERIVANICSAHRAEYKLSFPSGHPTLVNNPTMCDFMRTVASSEIDPPLETVSFITMAGEDFSEFASRAPGVFCFVGAGKSGQQNFPHHHSRFDIDEGVLQIGVELLVRGALYYFKEATQATFLSLSL